MSDAIDRVRSARWVIFDLDGTLFTIPIEWRPLRNKMVALCREAGAPESVEKIRDAYEFASSRPELKDRLLVMHRESEFRGIGSAEEVGPGTEMARWRLSRGLSSSLFTMNTRCTAERLVGSWGFSTIVAIEDVMIPKPDPEGIETIIKRLGASREGVMMIGNSEYDRIAARQASIDYVDITELG